MAKTYAALLRLNFLSLTVFITVVCINSTIHTGDLNLFFLIFLAAYLIVFRYGPMRRHLFYIYVRNSYSIARNLRSLPGKYIPLLIFVSAALSLYLELIFIRWQSTVFPFFAFYKNFGLLSCFAGLGIGYGLSRSRMIPLGVVLPLALILVVFSLLLRHSVGLEGFLFTIPFSEQTHMGSSWNYDIAEQLIARYGYLIIFYLFIAIFFMTTVLIFIPIGQLCGCLMDQTSKLPAYGLNLLGSIVGILAILLLSYFWTGPTVWFAIAAALILWFLRGSEFDLSVGVGAALTLLIALAWPVEPDRGKIYSPYQLIETMPSEQSGLMQLLTGGKYYMKVFDFGDGCPRCNFDPHLAATKAYYELPFQIAPRLDRVAVVGAGMGNDVAAALRMGANNVTAVEIDPAIVAMGRRYHPEAPYADPKVKIVVNDARTFFANTSNRYDAIVYGVLDSHTLLSQASSVRLDSFVYTVDGIRDSYGRLEVDGILSISFALLHENMGLRLFEMMRQATGKVPRAINTGYDTKTTMTFVVTKASSESLTVPAVFPDRTADFEAAASGVEVATDDWPFFYMKKREYPVSYLPVLAIMLLVPAFIALRLFKTDTDPSGNLSFLFLGAGFMLVETKAITELGLAFGNTWHVIAIAISLVLIMAFIANLAVMKLSIKQASWAYLLIILLIAIGFFGAGGVEATGGTGQKFLFALILMSPMLFSGIAFSVQISRHSGDLSGAMAFNIIGAMLGGLLEYNSMYFGFSSLYLFAAVMYAAAFVSARGGAKLHLPTQALGSG